MQNKLVKCQENIKNSIGTLKSCKYNSMMLLNLINDMLDLAKSEKMKFDLHNTFFDL